MFTAISNKMILEQSSLLSVQLPLYLLVLVSLLFSPSHSAPITDGIRESARCQISLSDPGHIGHTTIFIFIIIICYQGRLEQLAGV